MSDSSLTRLRAQIDAVDERIMTLLVERMAIVREVGETKSRECAGGNPIRPGREAQQVRRIVEWFRGTDFAPAAAASIWRSIIMASLAVEGALTISVAAGKDQAELPWLAREYFGNFLPMTRHAGTRRVVGDVLEGKASIGVLPGFAAGEQGRWWPDWLALSGAQARPRVFAHLPLVYAARPGRDALNVNALALGMVEPEPTGDDVSFLVLQAEENASMHGLQQAFAEEGLTATWVEALALQPKTRHHLVEVQGFVTPEHESMQKIIKHVGAALMAVEFLGAYARPVVIAP
ncbi:MAG: chorismate mutase [Alphaproteobacteria bacterium]|nr:chorismate mutase [Alphaproteobacteria bacterium]